MLRAVQRSESSSAAVKRSRHDSVAIYGEARRGNRSLAPGKVNRVLTTEPRGLTADKVHFQRRRQIILWRCVTNCALFPLLAAGALNSVKEEFDKNSVENTEFKCSQLWRSSELSQQLRVFSNICTFLYLANDILKDCLRYQCDV